MTFRRVAKDFDIKKFKIFSSLHWLVHLRDFISVRLISPLFLFLYPALHLLSSASFFTAFPPLHLLFFPVHSTLGLCRLHCVCGISYCCHQSVIHSLARATSHYTRVTKISKRRLLLTKRFLISFDQFFTSFTFRSTNSFQIFSK